MVPAHDEETSIGDTIASVRRQGRGISITVVADSCRDRTADIARRLRCDVIETRDNRRQKAGALNQALARVLPSLASNGYVLVVDADTVLGTRFLAEAHEAMRDPRVGAVGGIFRAGPKRNVIEQMQSNEYDRYARQIARRKAEAFVLTGTATMFRVAVLRQLIAARGYVYETRSRTEDNEVTLAILHLGYRAVSPKGCLVRTELMPTTRSLWRQRYRWYRGALEDLRRYGWTRTTAPYIVRQGLLLLSVVMSALWIVLTVSSPRIGFAMPWAAVWPAVTAIFVVERIATVKRGGPAAMALAGALLPEMLYAFLLQTVFMTALTGVLFNPRAERRW